MKKGIQSLFKKTQSLMNLAGSTTEDKTMEEQLESGAPKDERILTWAKDGNDSRNYQPSESDL